MLKGKFYIGILILIALLVFLGLLIYFNWSSDIWAQFCTALIIGTVSFFIPALFNQSLDIRVQFWISFIIGTVSLVTIFWFSLEENKLPEESFPTCIVMNELFHRPIIPINTNSLDLAWVKRYIALGDFVANSSVKKPENPDQTTTFLLDLLQYKIIYDMFENQNVGSEVDKVSDINVNGITHTTIAVFQPYKPEDLYKMDGKEVLQTLSNNPFSKTDLPIPSQLMFWNAFGAWLPEGTHLSIRSTTSSEGVEQRKIYLIKPMYFNIEITIEPLVNVDMGSIPQELVLASSNESTKSLGLTIDPEVAKQCRTYNFVIKMNATFGKFTSRSQKTEQYKKWTQWIFSTIERANSDKQGMSTGSS